LKNPNLLPPATAMSTYRTLEITQPSSQQPQLQLKELPVRAPERGEVAVRMLAAPINPADINLIEGTYGVNPEPPFAGGIEGVGVIEEVGPGFPGLLPGQQVIFLERVGTWTERVVCPVEAVLVIPSDIDSLQASMLKINPPTAYCLLKNFTSLTVGDTLIQNAANSAVGRCIIQLAKAWGVRTFNLVRRPEVIEELRAIGAGEVALDDDDAIPRLAELGWAAPRLALNTVGGASALRLLNALAPRGHHVTYGAMAKRPLKVPNSLLIFKELNLHGLWVSRWLRESPRPQINAAYEEIVDLMYRGQLVLPVERTYLLDQYEDAIAHARRNRRSGKILFQMATS